MRASDRVSKKQANVRKNVAKEDYSSSSDSRNDNHCGYKECFPFSPIAPCTPPTVCPVVVPTVPPCAYWPLEGPCCNIPGNGGCPPEPPPYNCCPPGYYCAPVVVDTPPVDNHYGQNNCGCNEEPQIDCRCVPYLCVECGFIKVELTVTTDTTTFSTFGQQIVFTYTVTNTGTAPLCFPYQIWDSKLGTEHFGPSLLFPGQSSAPSTRVYTITQSDIDEGILNGFITSSAAVYVRVPGGCAKPSPCCTTTTPCGGNVKPCCNKRKDSSSSCTDSSSSDDHCPEDIWVYSDTVVTRLNYVPL